MASFTVLYGQTIANLVHDWSINDNYSHGFLVPFIVAYMIWRRRKTLLELPSQSSFAGLFIVVLGMGLFVIGNIGAELFITRTSIMVTIAGICFCFYGPGVTASIAVPLAYMMFMIPLPAILWNKIAFPLQLFAANITAEIIQLLNIPLLREGNIMHLPNTTLEVVDACSGLRSLNSLLALSAAFAYLSNVSAVGKWLLFLSAVPIAIAVNIFRLVSTAFLARHYGEEMAQGFLHEFSGVIVFLMALLLLYGVYRLVCIALPEKTK